MSRLSCVAGCTAMYVPNNYVDVFRGNSPGQSPYMTGNQSCSACPPNSTYCENNLCSKCEILCTLIDRVSKFKINLLLYDSSPSCFGSYPHHGNSFHGRAYHHHGNSFHGSDYHRLVRHHNCWSLYNGRHGCIVCHPQASYVNLSLNIYL